MNANRLATCALLGAVLLAGCGAADPLDEEDQDFHPSAAMVGTWIFQSVTVNGAPANLADVLDWLPATTQSRLHIQANGAYVYEEVNSAGGQLWFESGFVIVNFEIDEFELNVQLDSDGATSDQVPLTFSLVGGVFTLEQIDGADTIVFTLTM